MRHLHLIRLLVFGQLLNAFAYSAHIEHQLTFDVGIHSQMGTRRGKMQNEDKYTIELAQESNNNSNLFGVYDGHGGDSVSTYLSGNLPNHIFAKMKHHNGTSQIESYLDQAFMEADAVVSNGRYEKVGSTATVGLIRDNKLFVANAGDSMLVLCRKDNSYFATKQHRPNTRKEIDRIYAAGGHIIISSDSTPWLCVAPQNPPFLSLSRAIGDYPKIPGLIGAPEVETKQLTPDDEFIILATDGFWDHIFKFQIFDEYSAVSEARKLVQKELKSANTKLNEIAKKLCEKALSNGSGDDITVMLIRLKWT
jgi:protein phosphatase 1L